jgi:hypothetical protein
VKVFLEVMKRREFWTGALGGAVGGCLGAVCGSSSLFVVGAVGASMGFLIVWLVSGFSK